MLYAAVVGVKQRLAFILAPALLSVCSQSFSLKCCTHNSLSGARGHVSVTDLDYWHIVSHAVTHANVFGHGTTGANMLRHKHTQNNCLQVSLRNV